MSNNEELDPECTEFYRHAIELLQQSRIPCLVGGAYALGFYTGVNRHTKDFDLFIRGCDCDRALEVFSAAGYRAEKTFPHWLAKIYFGDNFADLIFAAGNGLGEVNDSWFARARQEIILGRAVRVMAPEDMIWMKAFIHERERYDGADVAHLIRSCAEKIDWRELLVRFGPDWPVLLSQLILFTYVYPSERQRIPGNLVHRLVQRWQREQETPFHERICRGTLLSRAQYLTDIDEGYRDARLEPRTSMSEKDVEDWTAAIDPKIIPRAEQTGG